MEKEEQIIYVYLHFTPLQRNADEMTKGHDAREQDDEKTTPEDEMTRHDERDERDTRALDNRLTNDELR